MECLLKWNQDKKALICPCHEATFDIMGNIKSGPASKPLSSLDVRIVSGQILVGESYGG
jgi:Rieske Fe-S protein